jgi:hypothetical protein
VPTKADKLIDYCKGIAQEFQSRRGRMEYFVKKHNLTTGNANENILREFLSKHAPGAYTVGQGFLCNPLEDNEVSRQCDILIFDHTRHPLVYSDGPVSIVWPRAARMIIEVKTNFYKEDIKTALENILAAKRLNPDLRGVIFAFQSPAKLSTVIGHLRNFTTATNAPTAILLLDKGIVIHNWWWLRHRELSTDFLLKDSPIEYSYGVRSSQRGLDAQALVLVFLLFQFFLATEPMGLFESSDINTLIEAMEEYSNYHGKQPPIYIGGSAPKDDPAFRPLVE